MEVYKDGLGYNGFDSPPALQSRTRPKIKVSQKPGVDIFGEIQVVFLCDNFFCDFYSNIFYFIFHFTITWQSSEKVKSWYFIRGGPEAFVKTLILSVTCGNIMFQENYCIISIVTNQKTIKKISAKNINSMYVWGMFEKLAINSAAKKKNQHEWSWAALCHFLMFIKSRCHSLGNRHTTVYHYKALENH